MSPVMQRCTHAARACYFHLAIFYRRAAPTAVLMSKSLTNRFAPDKTHRPDGRSSSRHHGLFEIRMPGPIVDKPQAKHRWHLPRDGTCQCMSPPPPYFTVLRASSLAP
jgi:hypothetical protein